MRSLRKQRWSIDSLDKSDKNSQKNITYPKHDTDVL